jgi:hypothetical protein
MTMAKGRPISVPWMRSRRIGNNPQVADAAVISFGTSSRTTDSTLSSGGATVRTRPTPHPINPFFRDDRNHDQSRQRIGPHKPKNALSSKPTNRTADK